MQEISLMLMVTKSFFHSNDWATAQEKYIEWCSDDGFEVTVLQAGKDGGDD